MMRLTLASLGLLACVWQMPTMAQAAPNSAAQQAMQECALMYCGPRNPSVMQQKSTLVESCFRSKTGRTPAELGISLPSLRCCPGSPCY